MILLKDFLITSFEATVGFTFSNSATRQKIPKSLSKSLVCINKLKFQKINMKISFPFFVDLKVKGDLPLLCAKRAKVNKPCVAQKCILLNGKNKPLENQPFDNEVNKCKSFTKQYLPSRKSFRC